MHFYEPTLNNKGISIIQTYAMQGHFVDLKMSYAFGLQKALEHYDLTKNVPFMIFKERYCENEVHEYIRSMRQGFTIPNTEEYKLLRKAMALYHRYEERSDEETIKKIAEAIDRSAKFTCELLMAGLRNTLFVPFYKTYCDEEGEETAEDVTRDIKYIPEEEYFRKIRSEALWGAYEELDYREQMMIADNLAFCPECYGSFEMQKNENGEPVKVCRKKKSYVEIAIENELSEPDSVHNILQKAYGQMREKIKEKQ